MYGVHQAHIVACRSQTHLRIAVVSFEVARLFWISSSVVESDLCHRASCPQMPAPLGVNMTNIYNQIMVDHMVWLSLGLLCI